MQKKLPVLDTNILVRFLVEDVTEQIEVIGKLFTDAGDESLEVSDMVIAEVVLVLQSFYKKEKDEVIDKIKVLVSDKKFKVNRLLMKTTLEIYSREEILFVDAYLCAGVSLGKNEFLYTFDKRLIKIGGVKVRIPGE